MLNHNHRDYQNTPGVDKSKEHLNVYDGPISTYKEAKYLLEKRDKEIQSMMSRKMRSDTVRGFELLFASDKEFLDNEQNRDEYFRRATEWCKETFGEMNYIAGALHCDELGQPHLHVTVTCIERDENGKPMKYNAKKWVNNRQSLIEIQDSWFAKVENMGLERGKSAKQTHAYHQTKQEYAKMLQKDLDTVRGLTERDKELLAVKGLRQERQNKKTYESIVNKASNVSIDTNRIIEDIIAEDSIIIEEQNEKFNQELELLIDEIEL